MRGSAATGWGLLIAALGGAVLLVIGLYVWDGNARTAEVALRPPPVAPLAGPRPPSGVPLALPANGGPPLPTGDAVAGQTLFVVQCNACHPGASAGIGPVVRGQQLAERYPEDGPLAAIIRLGTRDMHPFPADQLSDQELANVVAYLRRL